MKYKLIHFKFCVTDRRLCLLDWTPDWTIWQLLAMGIWHLSSSIGINPWLCNHGVTLYQLMQSVLCTELLQLIIFLSVFVISKLGFISLKFNVCLFISSVCVCELVWGGACVIPPKHGTHTEENTATTNYTATGDMEQWPKLHIKA